MINHYMLGAAAQSHIDDLHRAARRDRLAASVTPSTDRAERGMLLGRATAALRSALTRPARTTAPRPATRSATPLRTV